jgi:catechol 2,3-dioxygenase-like lactoylglutathione lyase family enzyme
MNIVDHLSIGVPSISEGTDFYNELMQALGYQLLAATDNFAAYGRDVPQFLLMIPLDGNQYSAGNGIHIAFAAPSEQTVDAFYHYACAHGGQCEGKPGSRSAYPKTGVYTAFVRDPFGNKLEPIFNGFSA